MAHFVVEVRGAPGGVARDGDARVEELIVAAQQRDERLEGVDEQTDDGQVDEQQHQGGRPVEPRKAQILHGPSLARRGRVALQALLTLLVVLTLVAAKHGMTMLLRCGDGEEKGGRNQKRNNVERVKEITKTAA